MFRSTATGLSIAASLLAAPAAAQTVLDRADPATHTTQHSPEPLTGAVPIPVEVETHTPASIADGSVMVGAVRLVGLRALQPDAFADVIGDYVGRFAAPEDLAELAGKIAARARARGYVFASAGIEPQRLATGILTVTVDEGAVDAVRIDGADRPAVRAALAPLVTGRPVTLAEVERRLLIAGDIDGVRVRSSRYVREGGRGVLLVRLGATPLEGRAALTNDGTRPLGPEQVTLRVDARALLFDDDALTVAYTGTLAEPGEYQSGRVRYAKRVSHGGTEVAVSGSASHSRPGASLAPLDIVGRSWTAGLSVLQPLARRRAASLWLTADFDVRDLHQTRDGISARRDRLAVARLGLHGYAAAAGGRLSSGATLSRGFDVFGATEAGDPLASRDDADAVFTSLDAWAVWTRPLGGGMSVRLGVEAQLADRPLLVSEEAGLGGTAYLRGYDWSERSGDEGAMGSVELRYDWNRPLGLLRRAQLYGFVDGGRVTNLQDGFGGGSLASAGGGVRADVTRALGATVEVAAPLTGARYETGDRSPRVNLGLATTF